MLQQDWHIGAGQGSAPLWRQSRIALLSQSVEEVYFEHRGWPLWVAESVTPPDMCEWSGERIAVSITREIDNCLQWLESRGVRLKNIEEIREYFLQFSDMIDATKEIVSAVMARLHGIQLTLEVYQDPEIDDKHLVLYARRKNYDEDMMRKIRDVRKQFRKYLIDKSGWLHLTTDFQKLE